MNRAPAIDRSVQWLYAAECDDGGISAWKTADGTWTQAYPEVTGYLLPTMLAYGAEDLAVRCAGWLANIQNENGSWNGLDGIQRPFDTAAIIEGLRVIHKKFNIPRLAYALENAESWMLTQISPDGYLINSSGLNQPELYNLRASAIIGNEKELEYWKAEGLNKREQRSHYLAYALEGSLNLNKNDAWARNQIEMAYNMQTGLMPFFVRPDWRANHPSIDYCASAQMGILYHRVGLDASKIYRLLKGVIEPNGGVCQSNDDPRQIAWGVKFWLDFQKVMERS